MLSVTKDCVRPPVGMERPELPRSVGRMGAMETQLWGIAVVFYGIGDVVTTSVGLQLDGVYEAGPVAGVLIENFGLVSMLAVKVGLLVGFYLLWRSTTRPYRVGVPLGLAVVGVVVVWWNLTVQVSVLYL